jgi:hypothetical protein
MNFWIKFWTSFFVLSIVLFAGLAIIVTIGGFFNIRSLFKNLKGRSEEPEVNTVEKDS